MGTVGKAVGEKRGRREEEMGGEQVFMGVGRESESLVYLGVDKRKHNTRKDRGGRTEEEGAWVVDVVVRGNNHPSPKTKHRVHEGKRKGS